MVFNPNRGQEYVPYFAYLLRAGKLRRLDSKRRKEWIEYYKNRNPEDYERYIRWCKNQERISDRKYYY